MKRVQAKPPKRLAVLWSVGAFVLVLLLGIGLLTILSNAAPGGTVKRRGAGPVTTEFTLLHTNDTWGYTEPCG